MMRATELRLDELAAKEGGIAVVKIDYRNDEPFRDLLAAHPDLRPYQGVTSRAGLRDIAEQLNMESMLARGVPESAMHTPDGYSAGWRIAVLLKNAHCMDLDQARDLGATIVHKQNCASMPDIGLLLERGGWMMKKDFLAEGMLPDGSYGANLGYVLGLRTADFPHKYGMFIEADWMERFRTFADALYAGNNVDFYGSTCTGKTYHLTMLNALMGLAGVCNLTVYPDYAERPESLWAELEQHAHSSTLLLDGADLLPAPLREELMGRFERVAVTSAQPLDGFDVYVPTIERLDTDRIFTWTGITLQ